MDVNSVVSIVSLLQMIRFFLFQELDIASNYNEKEVGAKPNLHSL